MAYQDISPVRLETDDATGEMAGYSEACDILAVDPENVEAPIQGRVLLDDETLMVHWTSTGVCLEDREYNITTRLAQVLHLIET